MHGRSLTAGVLGSLIVTFAGCASDGGKTASKPATSDVGGLGGGGDGAVPVSGAGASDAGGAGAGGVDAGGTLAAGSSAAGTLAMGGATCEPEPTLLAPWPGQNVVQTLDMPAQFTSDMSGLTFDAEAHVLWAVNNVTSRLFRLLPSSDGFTPDAANGWATGKLLRYPGGKGAPDSEGVTLGKNAADGVYVCAEHDADDSAASRLSVLRYDASAAGGSLTATHEWNLTALLPSVEANAGLEAISWLPDDYLVERGFIDDNEKSAYAPARYPGHGSGVFVVGVEATGELHLLALSHTDSSATLLATVATPNPGVMGLEFDRDARQLWFSCDDTCGNKSGVLDIDTRPGSPTRGRFVVYRQFQRPSTLPDSNNEGIAIGSAADCHDGFKPFFWTDDADADGYSLRRDSIPCPSACF